MKVNVLKGVTISDKEIEDILKGVNNILRGNDVDVRLEFDSSQHLNRDVNDGGTGGEKDDGEVQESETGGLRTGGREELEDNFGQGKGIKIYFADELWDNWRIRGLAEIKDINVALPKAIMFLKDVTDTNESKINDATHEILHVLCLGGGHKVDANTTADANGHTTDPNNIMYPYNPFPDPCDPNQTKERGDDITPEQKKILETRAGGIGKAIEVEEFSRSPSQQQPIVTPVPIIRGSWVDGINDTSGPNSDLTYGFLLSESPFRYLQFDIMYAGVFSTQYVDLTVGVYFNTDNNDMTGSTFAGMSGIDKRIMLDVDFPPNYVYKGIVTADVYTIGDPDYTTIEPGSVQTLLITADVNDVNLLAETKECADGIHLSIPMYLLGSLADEVPVKIVSHENYSADTDEIEFVWEVVDHNEPVFELVNTLVYPGDMLHVTGYNFTPLSDVKILIEDELLGTASANADGVIDKEFFFPGSLPFDAYFVTARDVSGRFDFSVVEYAPNVGDLDWNTKVDLSDFAVFADNWLSGYDY
ncbi:MAG: hypothetical protein JW947_05000 [Sedimentisphaerales bacterium]|nr:hypothetical protein [Sedimentisphaerales bacterium]